MFPPVLKKTPTKDSAHRIKYKRKFKPRVIPKSNNKYNIYSTTYVLMAAWSEHLTGDQKVMDSIADFAFAREITL